MTDPCREPREPAGIPRWVRVGVIVAVLLTLVIVAVLLIGGGHQPRRHGMSDAAGHTSSGSGHR